MADGKKTFLEDSNAPECKHVYVATEKGREYVLENPAGLMVLQTKVDGALYGDGDGKKCDYSFSSKEFSTIILVELKGRDIIQAAKQLQSTIEDFKVKYAYKRYYGRIVASRVQAPDIQSVEYRRLSALLVKSGGNLDKKTRKLQEKLRNGFSL